MADPTREEQARSIAEWANAYTNDADITDDLTKDILALIQSEITKAQEQLLDELEATSNNIYYSNPESERKKIKNFIEAKRKAIKEGK